MKRNALLLIPAVILMTLSSCGKGPEDVDDATKNIDWNVDLTHPIELTSIYPSTGISGFGNDDSSKIIEEQTGYKVKYSELSTSNADTDVANIFIDQSQYNILKLTEAQYHPNAKDGLLLDLTSLLEKTESGRILYKLIDLMPYGWDAVKFTTTSGKTGIYAIPDFGYCVYEDSAFIWNVEHLKQIGYVDGEGNVKVPSTINEFSDALNKLKAQYSSVDSYIPLGIPGENSTCINALESAFNGPLNFYVDENGKIQSYIFNKSCELYVEYLHELRKQGCISTTWQNADNASVINAFSEGKMSCVTLNYWWVQTLVNNIVTKGNLAKEAGKTNNYKTAHDELVVWNTRIRGDGTHGSPVQEKARTHGGEDGVSYYTSIPYYMAKNAVYVIDYLAKKMLNFSNYYGGTSLSLKEIKNMERENGTKIDQDWITNNVHWMQIETPQGAEDFYPKGDYGFQKYEDYSEKVIYLRPYDYEISYEIDPKLPHPVADGESKTTILNNESRTYSLAGTTMTLKVQGGGIWVKLTDRYAAQIVNNSQYCTGTNATAANVLFHLRETGFDAWQVAVPFDETCISDPMSMMPPMEHWAPISILSRTLAKRGIASAIDCSDDVTPTQALNITRGKLLKTSTKGNDGTKYYYWSDEISNEMTTWYNEVKLKRK